MKNIYYFHQPTVTQKYKLFLFFFTLYIYINNFNHHFDNKNDDNYYYIHTNTHTHTMCPGEMKIRVTLSDKKGNTTTDTESAWSHCYPIYRAAQQTHNLTSHALTALSSFGRQIVAQGYYVPDCGSFKLFYWLLYIIIVSVI